MATNKTIRSLASFFLCLSLLLSRAASPLWVGAAAANYGLRFGTAAGNLSTYVTFGESFALHLATLTIETWFNRIGTGKTVNIGYGDAIPLVTKGQYKSTSGVANMNYFLGLGFDGSGNTVLLADFQEGATGTSPGKYHIVKGTTPIATGQWYHAAATYDGSTWRLYLNGALETELYVGQPVRDNSSEHAGLATALDANGSPMGYFDGTLDEVRIWNYARTQADIAQTVYSAINSPQPGLVARWSLDEGVGTTVGGSAGTNVTGTIMGTAYSWTGGASLVNHLPDQPIPVAPTDGSVGLVSPITLRAQVGDTDLDKLDVQFWGRAAGSSTAFGLIGTTSGVASGGTASMDWQGLEPGGSYEWYAVARDAAGFGPESAHSTFSTLSINRPPVAKDDSYTMVEGSSLNQTAPGVLANDEDNDGDALTAAIVTSPAHGTLSLNTDGSFVYTPSDGFYGTDSFTYQASDGQASSDVATVTVAVQPLPRLTSLSLRYSTDLTTWSDVSGDLSGFDLLLDAGQEFYYLDVVSLTANKQLGLGLHPFMLDTASLPSGYYDYWAARGVSAVAEPGTWQAAMWRIVQGESPMFFLRVDAGPEYGLVDGLQYALGAEATLRLSGDYPPGTYSFVGVIADDGGNQNQATARITLERLNHAPIAESQSVTTEEDVSHTVTLLAVDADGDELSYSIVATPGHGTLGPVSGDQVTYTPDKDYNGNDSFSFKASDGRASSETATVNISVLSINDAPVLAPVGDQDSAEGDSVLLILLASDVDGDSLTYSASGLPDGLSINAATGEISGTIAATASGASPFSVTVSVTDGSLDAMRTFAWQVRDTTLPQVTGPGPQSNREGEIVSLPLSATDSDGDVLTYQAAGLPPGLSLDTATGVISGRLTYQAAGVYDVRINVNDSASPANTGTAQFVWTVANVNETPMLSRPADQVLTEGGDFSLQVQAVDIDGDKLTYEATGLPDGLSMDRTSGLISGKAAAGTALASPYAISLVVSDDGLPTKYATTAFLISVRPPDPVHPQPSLTGLDPDQAMVGSANLLLVVSGNGFVKDSVVRWNDAARATLYVSPGQLVAVLLASDLADAGSGQVSVCNPSPGGGCSEPLAFRVLAASGNPVPHLLALDPGEVVAGSGGFNLKVSGQGFVAGAVLLWQGQPRPTTFVDGDTLMAVIGADDVATPGSAALSVRNPSPGGGTSDTLLLTIMPTAAAPNPRPQLSSVTPGEVTAGSGPIILELNGSGFLKTSLVRWNGDDRATVYVSSSRLVAVVYAADLSQPGRGFLSVANPAPNGGESDPLALAILEPARAPDPAGVRIWLPLLSR